MSTAETTLLVAAIAAVTLLTRALPFLFFRRGKTPGIILYLGKVLPPAVMAMLIVYCLRDTRVSVWPFGLPELISIAVVAVLHLIKRSNLLSILCGTAVYMLLVQFVFV
jgi:branched-subunit amino acid transport protein AzlD